MQANEVHQEPARVLLVEDNPGDRELVSAYLEQGEWPSRTVAAGSLRAALSELAAAPFDVVVLDLGLPDSLGLDTLRGLAAACARIPIVVLTGWDDEAKGLEAVQNGAEDYLVKGRLTAASLVRALRYAIERHQSRTRIEHLNSVLRAIRNVNQLIVREKDPRKLIQQACDMLIETRGYHGAWIVINARAGPPVDLAQAGWGQAFERFALEVRSGVVPPCWEQARGAPEGLAVLDPRDACGECPLHANYGHDVATCATLRHGAQEFGLLGVANAPGTSADDEEESLLVEVAGDLAFALHDIELEHERSQYARIVASSQEAMALLGRDYTYLAANPSYARLVGREAAGLVGRTLEEILGKAFFERNVRPALDRSLAGDEARVEAAREVPGVGRRVIEALYSPCREPDGAVSSVAVCIRDLTELRRSEESLRASEAALHAERDNLRAVTSSAPVALLVLDEHEQITFANPAAERLFGSSLTGVPRRRCGDFLRCVHRDEDPLGCGSSRHCPACVLNAAVKESLGSGRGVHHREMVTDLELEGGNVRRWIIVSAEPLLLDGRRHCVAAMADITGLRLAESDRSELEEQLRAAQKMEAIGSLAGGIAHDFNNLLSVILSYTEFALEAVRAGDPLRADLVEVQKAGERAADLTRQLLAFSRKQILQPVVLDLNQVVPGIEKMLRRILGEDIDFRQVLAPDLGLVRADPGQVEQVIMNLVINARDAMPAGGKLTIETATVELDATYAAQHVGVKPGPHVLLAVTDTGCGMDAQLQARIFEPFFTTKGKGKGTGLGLSTVYGIVKQSGGHIWVYSEVGQGTTFKIHLPRVVSAVAPDPRGPVPEARSVGTETILIVEDEEAVRHLAQRILRGAGYKVLTAANGGEALLACEAHRGEIHLVLTDVVMPQMSGRALADRLAAIAPGLKVLYMSGYTDNAIVHHGVLDAGTRFIGKPFNAAGLSRKVREVLDED